MVIFKDSDFARKQSDDQEWYFFCRLDYKYSNSKRVNRTTKNGNWKLTGKIRDIKLRRTGEVIGTKKNLVFQYKCPDSKKVVGTSWVIHEFQAKNSPPDERALVLCKLKYKANDWAATSPNDEGEPSRVMGFDVENTAAQTNIREVDAEQLLPLIDSHVEDFNFPLPLQSQNHVQNCLSDEEYLNEFADSFLIDPDEHENPAQYLLLNDDSPQASSSKAYVEGSSDGATYAGYGVAEVIKNHYWPMGNISFSSAHFSQKLYQRTLMGA
ncbi:unnamed protein product [Dovyalis caffra]|uniref:NAC domain-containing protein n=1 Tax=Dovyalis caffra TaxID=77055 RepID=A0AAV1SE79_9ROSI|nr:unnamed protein product [Dovyalis caffra]